MSDTTARTDDVPPFRYTARLADEIERKWQDRWEAERTFWTPNPSGPLSEGFERAAGREKLYVLDMFPYPSGAGLHVGHPLGYIGTDVYARFQRMAGHNVLHAMGYDAFGLPAEQYALETGQHPRVTIEQNIATMRRQLRRLGLGHDPRRGVSTTDVQYYRWTQWIFLQMFNAWFDDESNRARPIDELVADLESGARPTPDDRPWSDLDAIERRQVVDSYRLAYLDEAPVNWCPALGTVLANEEVTTEGRSERGNHPVYKRPLKQWKLRITEYAERLLADLDLLDWPESIKIMQRNWIGRSEGADIVFPVESHEDLGIRVFTTRPDTVFGATYMVVAPELDLVDEIVASEWPRDTPLAWRGTFGIDVSPPEAVEAYREFAGTKTDLERQAEGREKTGIFIGAYAINPVNDERIPIFIADYVLAGYGTGAIMAVPGQDQRDWDFAATGPPSTAGSSTASTSRTPSAGPPSGSKRPGTATARSPTSCATGCSAASGTGASRSRSCTTRRACPWRYPSRCSPSSYPRSATSSLASSLTTRRRSRSRHSRAPSSGSRSRPISATA